MNTKTMVLLFLGFLSIVICLNSCSSDYESEADRIDYSDATLNQMDAISLGSPNLPKITNYANFDSTTISMFHTLAKGTDGELYMYDSVNKITATIIEIMESQIEDNTDLCFLIDKTSSMRDDIFALQSGVNFIFEAIKKYENVNVALAFYGDKNIDGKNWLEYHDFTTDYQKIQNKFRKAKYTGGGDAPESVSDAAFEIIETLSWSSNSKRALLVLGDAPSLLPPLAKYTIEDLVNQASEKEIIFNYYPVVVGIQGAIPGPKKENLIATMYPNPVNDLLNIVLEKEDAYKIEVFDMTAKLVMERNFDRQKVQLNVSEFESGTYIVRVQKTDGSQVDSQKFMVQK